MTNKRANISKSKSEYVRSIDGIGGISAKDKAENGRAKFQLLDNMYVDYEGDADAVESIPGFRKLFSLGERINGIFLHRVSADKEYLIIHSGVSLFIIDKSKIDTDTPIRAQITVKDAKSSSFRMEGDLYIIDGHDLIRVDKEGAFSSFRLGEIAPYVPTVYKNGRPYEERNLLTAKAKECYYVEDPYEFSYGTPGLKYLVTDDKNKHCCVIGANCVSGPLFIPSYVNIDSEQYKVTEISPFAFASNREITALYTSPNLRTIRKGAFSDCEKLQRIQISRTVDLIDEDAFSGCTTIAMLHFDKFPLTLGKDSFAGCSQSFRVFCVGDVSDFSEKVSGCGLEKNLPISTSPISTITLGFNIYGMFSSVNKVTVDIQEIAFEYDEATSSLKLDFGMIDECQGKEIVIHGTLHSTPKPLYKDECGFLGTDIGMRERGEEAVLGCNICEAMDGRIFLSANPNIPGAVFYSGKDRSGNAQPTYFGINGYFFDGLGADPVTDLLSANGELVVFKASGGEEGTIFCHKAEKNEKGDVSYPANYVHNSIPVYGGAICFSNEALFLTKRGIYALDKAGTGNYREAQCRSENITPILSREELRGAEVTEWLGYLVVAAGDHFYLGDSRVSYKDGGSLQYEWYRLTSIGTYKNDRRLYRYSTIPMDGYELSNENDAPASGTVFSELHEGETVYFVYEDERKIRVYPTKELVGGVFDPARTVKSDGVLLFFGTEGGDVCLFNNDKRGKPPKEISEETDFDAVEYEKAMGESIHPSYYSFASHRANYGVVTPFDDCDIPYLTKNSVRGSLVIKFKSFTSSAVTIRTETDRIYSEQLRVPISRLTFDSMDFSTFAPSVAKEVTVTLPESERGWVKKRYSIYSDGFCSPFGVYSISYRYKIKGKIKE